MMYSIVSKYNTGAKHIVEQKIDGILHSQFNEPTRVIYDVYGNIIRKEHHIHGKLHGTNAVMQFNCSKLELSEDYDNGSLVKRVEYESGNPVRITHWYKGKLHRDNDLPAVEFLNMNKVEYYKHGIKYIPNTVEYKQYGKYVAEDQVQKNAEYKKITTYASGKRDVEIYDHTGTLYCIKTYLDTMLHSFNDEPAMMYIHQSISYTTRTLFYYYHDKPYSRYTGAAHVELYRNDRLVGCRWIDNDRMLHNENGPALIIYETNTPTKYYYIHGKRLQSKEHYDTYINSRKAAPYLLLHLFDKKYNMFDPNIMRVILSFNGV